MPRDQVFISYSHEDTKWREDLEKNLKPYLRDGSIISWSDEEIKPGSQWFGEIQSALANSKVAVLLVTPDFLASDFIYEHELGPLLKEAEQGGIKILWVPVHNCAWKKTALTNYQAVLGTDKPLADMTKTQRDRAWLKVCDAIEAAINSSGGGAEISAVDQILLLANEYEEIRRTLAGDNRTSRLGEVASRMRSLALPAYPLLGNLVGSESAGQRLAAISILEAIPDPAYLPWLTDRIAAETKFIAYHAAVALRNAARDLSASNRAEVQEAIRRALQNLDRMSWKDPNQIAVLRNAEQLAEGER
jgi:hypothetical protein